MTDLEKDEHIQKLSAALWISRSQSAALLRHTDQLNEKIRRSKQDAHLTQGELKRQTRYIRNLSNKVRKLTAKMGS